MSVQLDATERGPAHSGAAARERMLTGLPVTERRLKVADVSTTILEGGDGPPLVLLHGGIECGGAFVEALADALRKAGRVNTHNR